MPNTGKPKSEPWCPAPPWGPLPLSRRGGSHVCGQQSPAQDTRPSPPALLRPLIGWAMLSSCPPPHPGVLCSMQYLSSQPGLEPMAPTVEVQTLQGIPLDNALLLFILFI